MQSLIGTGVALITPFKKDFSVDTEALKAIVNYQIDNGIDYLVVLGTTAESATLSSDEKELVIKTIVETNNGRLPLVLGVGGNNTHKVVEELKSRDFSAFDAILSVSPYYNKPTQEGIYQHFKAVADASPVPVMLYNVPGRTASNISAETTLRLAAHKNIFAIKEASGNIEQCMKIAKAMPKDFLLISGDDLLTVPLYSIGAKGVISVLANAYPVVFQKMKEFSFAGDFGKASREQFKILEINGPMYEEGNPVGVKQVMADMGLCSNNVRLPLVPASEGLKKKIRITVDQ